MPYTPLTRAFRIPLALALMLQVSTPAALEGSVLFAQPHSGSRMHASPRRRRFKPSRHSHHGRRARNR